MKTKRCPECEKVKDILLFYKDKSAKSEFGSYCKDCHNLLSRTWKENNRGATTVRNKTWRKNNPEKTKAQGARARAKRKRICIDHYGGKCVCCGESEIYFFFFYH